MNENIASNTSLLLEQKYLLLYILITLFIGILCIFGLIHKKLGLNKKYRLYKLETQCMNSDFWNAN